MTPGAAQWAIAAGLAVAVHLAAFYSGDVQSWRATQRASGAPEAVWGLTRIALSENIEPAQAALPQDPVAAEEEIAPVDTNVMRAVVPAEEAPVAVPDAVGPVEDRRWQKPVEKPKEQKKRAKPEPKKKSVSGGPVGRPAGNGGRHSATAGNASYSNYAGAVAAHLRRYKHYPVSAGRARGTARVAFSLSRSGGLRSVRLTGSSGNATLDRAALDMVRRASPFPSMPPNLNRNSASFSVPIRFSR